MPDLLHPSPRIGGWSRNSLPCCKTQLTYKIRVRGLLEMLLRFRHCHNANYSRGGNWSIRESVLIAATNSGSSLHLLDHSALVHRMFCSVVQEKSMIFYSIELPFSLYDQIYVYLFHTQIYVYFFMYFYFIVTVSAEMDLSTQLLPLSYSSVPDFASRETSNCAWQRPQTIFNYILSPTSSPTSRYTLTQTIHQLIDHA